MKKAILPLLAVLLAGGGCARRYVITLSNGVQIGTRSKPHLQGGTYVFKDAMGRKAFVPAGRVTEIAPASMMQSSPNAALPAKPPK